MKARVYDIINAGPRHRFMTSAGVVSNCGRLLQTQNLPRPSGKDNLVNPHEGDGDVDEQTINLAASGNPALPLIWYKDINVLAADCIRGMLVASEGKDFICSDFSAVEGRGLAYLAGEDSELEAYRSGKDIYKVNASLIYSIPYEQVDGGGKGAQRQVGKTATLACLAEDTKVLTDKGEKPLSSITSEDKVFDGHEFVECEGFISRGTKKVIDFFGLEVTPDHEIEIGEGIWMEAGLVKWLAEKCGATSMELLKKELYAPIAKKSGGC